MQETLLEMFRELTEAPGVPGNEKEARNVMKKYLEPHVDEVSYDGLGSLIGTKVGDANGPKIMLAGHLDEVGFMVTQITEDGFLKFQTLGGWWSQVMLAQRVHIQTAQGLIEGIVGSVPPHLMTAESRKKVVEIKDMFIDIGASGKKEAEEFGVRPGDAIIPICPFSVMKNPKLMVAKAWDNRLGCAVAIEVAKRLKERNHPNTLYAVGTVQEEVGSRGGRTVAQKLQPDIGIAVDVGIAGDTPGINRSQALSKMGAGPEICLYDATMIGHVGLREFIISVAEEEKIPYQLSIVPGGGTDAGPMHTVGSGIPSVCLSVPTRYIHSHASILHYDDFENLVKLIVALMERLDQKQVDALRTYL
ncbi:M42 family metallopeptidase [Brevibacillus ginsengisoli]|uniref:M42 family metallopeptidase n=1 Tax=Brevibacillus ginsengisoli TaxID=363854 RepID=UPI003CF2EB11